MLALAPTSFNGNGYSVMDPGYVLRPYTLIIMYLHAHGPTIPVTGKVFVLHWLGGGGGGGGVDETKLNNYVATDKVELHSA